MKESAKSKVTYIVLGLGVCLLVFFGYKILFMAGLSEYAKEFTAGCIGAVITIFATAALLKSQSDSEIRKDQVAGIFKEKLKVYSSSLVSG